MYAATTKMTSSERERIPSNHASQKIHPPVFRTGVMVGSIGSARTPAPPVTTTSDGRAPRARRRSSAAVSIGRDSRNPDRPGNRRVQASDQESRRGDSNPRPTTYEAVALPLSYSGGMRGRVLADGVQAPPAGTTDGAGHPGRWAADRHHAPMVIDARERRRSAASWWGPTGRRPPRRRSAGRPRSPSATAPSCTSSR